MMTFKLAYANIRKSVQDYTIYYLTIIFSAALFYAFNSLGVQAQNLDLQSRNALESIQTVMSGMTIFLSFIFGFLLVYANNYLIRRRKKELGIYQLLGMKKTQVAKILTLEILLSSLVSLAIGILLGVFLSHFLYFVTASVMQTKITNFHFMFSMEAMKFTITCFVLMFLVVWIFTIFSVTQVKLIDLFQASRRNEDVKLRNPYVAGVIFIGALAMIAWACVRLHDHKYNEFLRMVELSFPTEFVKTTLILIIGTIMLFYSFAAAYLMFAKSRKKSYFSGLNMFSVRQISSRFTNATSTMVVMSLLLFFTLSCLTTSLGFNSYFRWMEENLFPFDMSISSTPHFVDVDDFDIYAPGGETLEEHLKKVGLDNTNDIVDKRVYVQVFFPEAIGHTKDDMRLSKLIDENIKDVEGFKKENKLTDEEFKFIGDEYLRVVTYSQYLNACKFVDVKPVAMNDSQYLLAGNMFDRYPKVLSALMQNGAIFDANGHSLTPASNESLTGPVVALLDTAFGTGSCEGVIVVPDNLVDTSSKMSSQSEKFILKEGVDNQKAAQRISSLVTEGDTSSNESSHEWSSSLLFFDLADYQKNINSGKLVIVYMSFYLGFVLTMTVATILSIQQLSSALDSRKSYEILRKIGVSDELCRKSLLKQVMFYYISPLVVAAFYAGIAMFELKENVSGFITLMLGPTEIVALAGFILIYILYMLVTYQMSKRIISQN